jgi:pimeloyl-ACP methyl ester carboxylesterase
MLAGSIFPFRQGLSGQLRRFADIRLAQADLLNYLLLHKKADDFEACLEEASSAPEAPQECLFNVTFRAFAEEAERASTTLATLTSLDVPLFALQGVLDRNIDPQSLERVAEAVAERDAEVHVVGGVGHTLVHEADSDEPRLSPEVAELLRDFLASVKRAE